MLPHHSLFRQSIRGAEAQGGGGAPKACLCSCFEAGRASWRTATRGEADTMFRVFVGGGFLPPRGFKGGCIKRGVRIRLLLF